MSAPAKTIHLPAPLRAELASAAARAFPSECCGLLIGTYAAGKFRVSEIHRSSNLAEDTTRRFLIDPVLQFRLLREFRGSDIGIIGCFHSHPNGAPAPSATDLAEALEHGFVWVVLGGNPGGGFALGAYVYDAERKAFDTLVLGE